MQGAITDELRVLVTAEVDKAIRSLKSVDSKTSETEKLFKSLGGSIAGAFSIKAVSDFARKSAEAWRVQKEAVSVMNQVLKSTGAEAWTSSAELQEMAASLQQVTNYGDETITSMHGVLLGFRNITGKNFEHASKAILDMATVMKMDLASAAQVVGKALDDPINGLGSLSRQGFHFTEQQKQMLKAMVEAGDMMGAQKIILEELDVTYGGAAEAGADLGTQVKNSAGDILEGFGKVFSLLGEHSGALKLTKEALDAIADAFNNVERNAARLSGGDKYNDWYEGLEDTEKLKEATDQIRMWEEEYKKAKKLSDDAGGRDWVLKQDENRAEKQLYYFKVQKENLIEQIQYKKDLQSITNAETRAEEELDKAVSQVGETYKKFAKDDPAYKLKELQKALEEISKQRADIKPIDTKELEAELKRLNELKLDLVRQSYKAGDGLSGLRFKEQVDEAAQQILLVQQKIAAANKHNAGLLNIDTNELNANLDAAEKAILQKMAKIKANGKKTWQEIFSDTTGVDKSLFSTGEQAADEYIKGLHARVEEEKEIGTLLGKAISPRKALESEMAEIERTINELLAVPEEKFLNANGGFETKDNAIKKLIDRYKELSQAIEETPADVPIGGYADMFDMIAGKVQNLCMKLSNLNEVQAQTVGSMMGNLASVSFDGIQSGVTELAEKLAEGADASDAWAASLEKMATDILNQLPSLFTRAGLELIAEGMWPIGIGLLAAGLGTSFLSGAVNGVKAAGSKANALGGVYGADGFEAFALGGSFTNGIVDSPTFFKFRQGSGFATGLMGEAGPEAIMPLARGSDGSLGVKVAGGEGGQGEAAFGFVTVNVYSSEKSEVNEQTDADGNKIYNVIVGAVKSATAQGQLDRTFQSRFGLKARGV